MSLPTLCKDDACACNAFEVVIQHQVIQVEVNTLPEEPVIEVLIPGERGASSVDKPFDVDPVQIYLKAKKGEP